MDKLPADVIRDCLANAVARYLKQGWQLVATGPTDAYLGRAKAKHNGLVGGGLLALFSVPLAMLWTVGRNLDTKNQGMHIHISEYDASLTETPCDYEQMMAQLALQQGGN